MSTHATTAPAEPRDGLTPPRRRHAGPRRLADLLVELGLVHEPVVRAAQQAAAAAGTTAEEVLLQQGILAQDGLSRAIAERHGLDHVDLTAFKVDMTAAGLIPGTAAKKYEAIPIAFAGERGLLVAMADPTNVRAVDDIALMTGYDVRPVVATADDVGALVSRLTRLDDVVASTDVDTGPDEHTGPAEVHDLREGAEDAPVIKLVNSIVAQAVERGTSDVHFEPEAGEMRVRFRIDGVLVEAASIPRRMVAGVVSRVKVMCDLDIAERRVPQDGRVALTIDGHQVDLRVVTLPSVHGESVVMRILDKSSVVMELARLGMQPAEHERFRTAFHQAYGAVLVTGPTGSGKSTTLYAALGDINTPEKNIITIEDPVEYQLQGITQVQVNNRAGLTFANGLRSMMRADPDVIMVGEIRDKETAQIAVEAALTGHLVLSTLHTNDAPTAITRLVEMGIEPFLVASAIDCVVAQRLTRTLCTYCKRQTTITSAVLAANGFGTLPDLQACEPVGCTRCGGSGYKGRLGLYEVMKIDDEVRELAVGRASADAISEAATRKGMARLRDDGLTKVRAGLTSIAEVARVTGTT